MDVFHYSITQSAVTFLNQCLVMHQRVIRVETVMCLHSISDNLAVVRSLVCKYIDYDAEGITDNQSK